MIAKLRIRTEAISMPIHLDSYTHLPHQKHRKVRERERGKRADLVLAAHKRPYVGISQGTVLGIGDGFGAILRGTVAKR